MKKETQILINEKRMESLIHELVAIKYDINFINEQLTEIANANNIKFEKIDKVTYKNIRRRQSVKHLRALIDNVRELYMNNVKNMLDSCEHEYINNILFMSKQSSVISIKLFLKYAVNNLEDVFNSKSSIVEIYIASLYRDLYIFDERCLEGFDKFTDNMKILDYKTETFKTFKRNFIDIINNSLNKPETLMEKIIYDVDILAKVNGVYFAMHYNKKLNYISNISIFRNNIKADKFKLKLDESKSEILSMMDSLDILKLLSN